MIVSGLLKRSRTYPVGGDARFRGKQSRDRRLTTRLRLVQSSSDSGADPDSCFAEEQESEADQPGVLLVLKLGSIGGSATMARLGQPKPRGARADYHMPFWHPRPLLRPSPRAQVRLIDPSDPRAIV